MSDPLSAGLAGLAGEPLLAEVVRGGVVESAHHGALVVLRPDGSVLVQRGDPDAVLLPRSSSKPLQAVGLLEAGLGDVADEASLAIVCASHSGEPSHLEQVRRLLATGGLDESALANTPALPFGEAAQRAHLAAGGGETRLTQNCSGKHAGMVVTAAAAGWPVAGYLDPDHPVQRAVTAAVSRLTGAAPTAVEVDGCGAPLLGCTLRGLARAFGALATAAADAPEARVVAAVRAHPWLVGGTGRDVTALIEAVPGLVAKDGAEGVYAAALADGTSVAVKARDGANRAALAGLLEGLRVAGVPDEALAVVPRPPVLGGGRPVGEVRGVRLDAAP